MSVDRDYLVELQTLGSCILEYSAIRNKLKELLDSCDKQTNRLYIRGWKGESMDSFKEKFDKWIKDGNDFCENMNMLENSLKVMYKNASDLKDDGGKLSSYL